MWRWFCRQPRDIKPMMLECETLVRKLIAHLCLAVHKLQWISSIYQYAVDCVVMFLCHMPIETKLFHASQIRVLKPQPRLSQRSHILFGASLFFFIFLAIFQWCTISFSCTNANPFFVVVVAFLPLLRQCATKCVAGSNEVNTIWHWLSMCTNHAIMEMSSPNINFQNSALFFFFHLLRQVRAERA